MDIISIDNKSYGIFYVYESQNKPIICKKDETDILKNGDIYISDMVEEHKKYNMQNWRLLLIIE